MYINKFGLFSSQLQFTGVNFINDEMGFILNMYNRLPPSGIEVMTVLNEHDSLTIKEIGNKLPDFNERTLRYAIRRLLENKVVVTVPNLSDMRRVYYRAVIPNNQLDKLLITDDEATN
ncbi:MAG: BlaI/MecI/CopY family transcriptional regulator [Candidatus Heimdallarchaeota archaeon]|nr:BlaI/MecI/CopY family transcriptional regulator [Candidatus Heimdallarchaeota archaeon]